MLRAATFDSRAFSGSADWAAATAAWTSACLAAMSVPNSYSMVVMLMPSFEYDVYSLMSLVARIACSMGVVTVASTSLAEAPGTTVTTVR